MVFPEHNIAGIDQIIVERAGVIGPGRLVGKFGLKTPFPAELGRTNLAFAAFGVLFGPYMLTPHPAGILHTFLKDAAKLVAYFAATALFGALLAPPLYWAAQWLGGRGILPFLAEYEFQRFFHRALLVGALLFFWPLLRWLRIGGWRGLGLEPNSRRFSHAGAGFLLAAVPLLCFGWLLLTLGVFSLRSSFSVLALGERTLTAIVVPFIEEPLFRGLFLGVLLRSAPRSVAVFLSSGIFSIVHFLKPAEQPEAVVTWWSGFGAVANSFSQFGQPLLLAAGFTTLFLLGWILADARIRTRSLWLPIGLHSGWIFASAIFNKVARREMEALPWLGKNLLIGIAPLCVALISWALLRAWLKHVETPKS